MAAGPPDQMPSRFVQEGGGDSRRNRPVSEAWLRYLDSTLNPPARGRPRTRTGGLADAPDVPSRRDGGARPAPCPPHVRPLPVLPSPPLLLPSPSPIALGREGSMACTSLFPCAAEGALRRRGAQQQTGRARRRRQNWLRSGVDLQSEALLSSLNHDGHPSHTHEPSAPPRSA